MPIIMYKAKPTVDSQPWYWQNPTQPTTNRKIETDFEKKVFSNAGAFHGYIMLTEYPWA